MTKDQIILSTREAMTTAFAIAEEVWHDRNVAPSPEALQATAATALIHMTKLSQRNGTAAPSQSAGRATPGTAPGRPAPSSQAAGPKCPVCEGEMWDNRESKKNPRAPDYKCKTKECEGVIWPPKAKKGASSERQVVAAAAGGRGGKQNFEVMPDALKDDAINNDEDDLPF